MSYMKTNMKRLGLGAAILAGASTLATGAFAQDSDLAAQVAANAANDNFIFTTLLFLLGGVLVMWMAAGFAMLEAGLVRTKNVSMQCLKNITLYSVAGLMYWVLGYNLMYTGVDGGFLGSFGPYSWPDAGASEGGDYSVASDWFFQMVFCATTASITGWLDQKGFSDFAGSTLVHSVGGWAALAGAILLGARAGKYGKDGKVQPMLASSIPLATLGTFILWMGWFGFNGASQLAFGTIADAADVSKIFANTNLAACGGVVTAVILTRLIYKKMDVTMALNGALAGLVAITAEPLMPSALGSVLIGSVGGAIVVFAVPLLDKLKIDDVVGAIPVHLLAGIFGTMIVPASNSDASYGVQFLGVISIGAFTMIASFVVWFLLKMTIGIRVSEEDEYIGLDQAEVGVPAYPEFVNS